jgi:hypothetical protein
LIILAENVQVVDENKNLLNKLYKTEEELRLNEGKVYQLSQSLKEER